MNRYKPRDCTCDYPRVIVRTMCGHSMECPVYVQWQRTCLVVDDENSKTAETPAMIQNDFYFVEPETVRGGSIEYTVKAPDGEFVNCFKKREFAEDFCWMLNRARMKRRKKNGPT